ncbi:MAG: 50S ribosomal protein L6 [Bacilli bacterium]|nr:50S ribosomal protein L6 [Bacilli bacterium]
MSRIGNRKLLIPEGVTVELDSNVLTVKGHKGQLLLNIPTNVIVKIEDNELTVERKNEQIKSKQIHGTINALISNMMEGVSKGYEKGLEIVGVGYRFQVKDKTLVINAGYSHQVEIRIPDVLKLESISNTEIVIKGIDKQAVGELAAEIRKVREPEPYKGKGIRYKNEKIRRKEGKKASK